MIHMNILRFQIQIISGIIKFLDIQFDIHVKSPQKSSSYGAREMKFIEG